MTDRKLTPRQQLVKEGTEYLFAIHRGLLRVYSYNGYGSVNTTAYYHIADGFYNPIPRYYMEKELELQFKFRLNNAAVKEIFNHIDRLVQTKGSNEFTPVYGPQKTRTEWDQFMKKNIEIREPKQVIGYTLK